MESSEDVKIRREYITETIGVLRGCLKIAGQEIGKNPSGDDDTRQQYIYSLGMTLFAKNMPSFKEWNAARNKRKKSRLKFWRRG